MAPTPKKHALLIGVNFYFTGEARKVTYKNLRGCVPDVLSIEELLTTSGEWNITKLTATPNAEGTKPIEDTNSWPTYHNIARELQRITDSADAGDVVYIHYSGHGVRRDQLPNLIDGGDKISGTALVPTDVCVGGAYLTGYNLGVRLAHMVQHKKLRAFLALDSCFSGQGLRDAKFTVRSLDEGVSDGSFLDSDRDADRDVARLAGTRAVNTEKYSWLAKLPGCTVLTACGDNETASETYFNGSGPHGVLTYWMADILRREKERLPSYRRAWEDIVAKIASMSPAPRQEPVLHGEDSYEFFGAEMSVEQNGAIAVQKDKNTVELNIGRAQGVVEGAIYEIRSDKDNGKTQRPIYARVMGVSDFQSRAMVLRRDDSSATVAIGSRSRAVLRYWALPEPSFVELVGDQLKAIESPLTTEIRKAPNLDLWSKVITDAEPAFKVSIDHDSNFDIFDFRLGSRLSRLPKVSSKDENAVKKLAYILRHISRFRYIESLRNPILRRSFPSEIYTFSFELIDAESNKPLTKSPSSGKYELIEDQEFIVSLRVDMDLAPRPKLHVAFFNLNATWGIQKIFPADGKSTEAISWPRQVVRTEPVSISVPKVNDDDPSEIDDVIKAWVYEGDSPPSLDEIALPDLSGEDAVEDPWDDGMEDADEVSTRASKIDSVVKSRKDVGKWITLDIVIHTRALES